MLHTILPGPAGSPDLVDCRDLDGRQEGESDSECSLYTPCPRSWIIQVDLLFLRFLLHDLTHSTNMPCRLKYLSVILLELTSTVCMPVWRKLSVNKAFLSSFHTGSSRAFGRSLKGASLNFSRAFFKLLLIFCLLYCCSVVVVLLLLMLHACFMSRHFDLRFSRDSRITKLSRATRYLLSFFATGT
jgi:hypothetical protein